MNKCPHCGSSDWYYRAAGAWCPGCKHLFKPGTEEYLQLTFVERKR